MKRSRVFLFTFFLLAPVFIAQAQVMQLIPCVGGDACRACDLVALFRNVIEFLLLYIVPIVVVLLAVISGFKMITTGEGSGALKTVGVDIFKGLILILCAWLIVDTGLKILVQDQSFGPWNEIQCIDNPRPESAGMWTPGARPSSSDYTGPIGGGEQCASDNLACSVAALQQVGYTEAQANVMSCIAMTESTGNPNVINPDPRSLACGTFQAVKSHWSQPYAPSGCSYANCTNVDCNLKMAYTLSQQRIQQGTSPYGPWTCPGCNAKAAGCVAKYDPGR